MSAQAARRPEGDRWEAVALDSLRRQGLALVHRNYHCRFGEIDLVMREDDVLCFIEVRYRARSDYGGAAASVDAAKCRRIAAAARHFLARHVDFQRWPCRFDVVTVGGETKPDVQWIRDAFRLDDC